MVLVRNPLYHGRLTGNVQRLELSFLYWSPAQLEMYEADELDVLFVWALPQPDRRHIRYRHAEEYLPIPFPSTFGVVFDVTRPPFDDRRVRRAFVLATDREMLANVVGHALSAPATGGLVPHAMPGHSPGIGLPYDPQRARQLLAEAGFPDGRGFPLVDGVADPDDVHYTEKLRTQWRESLGVDIAWRLVPGRSAFPKEAESPHLWYYGLVPAYPDPDIYLRLHSPARIGWRDKTYDMLVEQARREMDPLERMRLYRQADRMLIEEAVILPLIYGLASMLVKPWVMRLPTTPFGWWLWKDVVIEPH
jgi:oligopeptide transport system substrate-binding protein